MESNGMKRVLIESDRVHWNAMERNEKSYGISWNLKGTKSYEVLWNLMKRQPLCRVLHKTNIVQVVARSVRAVRAGRLVAFHKTNFIALLCLSCNELHSAMRSIAWAFSRFSSRSQIADGAAAFLLITAEREFRKNSSSMPLADD